jgi:hypothetical protein
MVEAKRNENEKGVLTAMTAPLVAVLLVRQAVMNNKKWLTSR